MIYLSGFYELSLMRLQILYLDEEMQNRMADLINVHRSVLETPSWQWRSIRRQFRNARIELSRLYELRVQHSR